MSTKKPSRNSNKPTVRTAGAKKPPARKIVGARTKFGNSVSESSRRYLVRQAKDGFSTKARRDGYRSRAAYKLVHLQDKHKLIKPSNVVVDLGAAPGGWCQVIMDILSPKGKLVAMDILRMDPMEGVAIIKGDFNDEAVVEELDAALEGRAVDVVVSDMAPNTTGSRSADHLRIMQLVEEGLVFALRHLKPGGHFACKLFMGGEEIGFREELRKHFEKVVFEKPDSSRKDSREMFIVALRRKKA